MVLDQPKIHCPKCGTLVPSNIEILTAWDDACKRAKAAHLMEPAKPKKILSRIACEQCARVASKGMPREVVKLSKRQRERNPVVEQIKIDVSNSFID